jgi:hypothetical protein
MNRCASGFLGSVPTALKRIALRDTDASSSR